MHQGTFDHSLLRALWDDPYTLIFILDDGGKIRDMNACFRKVTGLAGGERASPGIRHLLVDPAEADALEGFLKTAGQAGPARSFAHSWNGTGGEKRYVTWSAAAFRDEAGHLLFFCTGKETPAPGALRAELAQKQAWLEHIGEIGQIGY